MNEEKNIEINKLNDVKHIYQTIGKNIKEILEGKPKLIISSSNKPIDFNYDLLIKELGVNSSTFNRLINGKYKSIPLENLLKLCDICNIKIYTILKNTGLLPVYNKNEPIEHNFSILSNNEQQLITTLIKELCRRHTSPNLSISNKYSTFTNDKKIELINLILAEK